MSKRMRMGGIEVRTGIPCPKCGATSRSFEESCEARIKLRAFHSLIHQRDNKTIGFEKSSEGGTSSANKNTRTVFHIS